MIALLRYSIGEASLSLARGWRSSLLAIAILAAAVFIAGAVLLVSINVDRILERLAATAELTIYLKPGEGDQRRAAVAGVLSAHPTVSSSNFVGADAALARFRRELPELAALVGTFREAGFSLQQRLAILYRHDVHGGIHSFAFISRMRGLHVRAFSEFEAALVWLSAKPARPVTRSSHGVPIPVTTRISGGKRPPAGPTAGVRGRSTPGPVRRRKKQT